MSGLVYTDSRFQGSKLDETRSHLPLWLSLWKGRYFDALPLNIFEVIKEALDAGDFFRAAYDSRTIELNRVETALKQSIRDMQNFIVFNRQCEEAKKALELECVELRKYKAEHSRIISAAENLRKATIEAKKLMDSKPKRSRKAKR